MKKVYDEYREWILLGSFLLIALFSFFVVADSSLVKQIGQDTAQYLDDKKTIVTGLTAASAATSFGVGMIPGGDAFSETVADLSKYFLIVFAAIWIQKYLIGITGLVTFKLLIPLALVGLGANVFLKKEAIKKLALKLLVFAALFFLTIPSSIALSRQIERTHANTVEQTIKELESSNKAVQKKVNSKEGLLGEVKNAWSNMTASMQAFLSDKMEEMQAQFSNMIDAIAVLIVTTCIIPLLVFAFLLWFIKLIFGIDLSNKIKLPSALKKKKDKKTEIVRVTD
ncbi:hypothetical protein ACVR1I_03135 [Streptococcus cameli]